jgi:hypothetical protein
VADVESTSGTILLATSGPAAVVASVGDPDGTRTLTSIVALLIALGVALIMIAIWLWKTTRPDPELLAPLEAMGERQWRRADPVWQRRRLDELRPDGADPLAHSVAPPEIDEAFDAGPAFSGFDDLDDISLRLPDDSELALDEGEHDGEPGLGPPSGGPVGHWTPELLERPEVGEPEESDGDGSDGDGSDGDGSDEDEQRAG